MNNDNNQAGVDEHLTRAQYRSQIKHKRGLFGHHQNELRQLSKRMLNRRSLTVQPA